ncbi:4018_t:CDS:2 [Gigaspora rosea]|nr:4018_t:CDS:2 [Gigaspora rosea]
MTFSFPQNQDMLFGEADRKVYSQITGLIKHQIRDNTETSRRF